MASKNRKSAQKTPGTPQVAQNGHKRQSSVHQTTAASPKPTTGWAAIAASKLTTAPSPPAPAVQSVSISTVTKKEKPADSQQAPSAPALQQPSAAKRSESRSKKSPSPSREPKKEKDQSKAKHTPVNGFNREQIYTFLSQRMKKFEKAEKFQQSGSEWATKSTNNKKTEKHSDVVLAALSRAVKTK